MFPVPEQSRLLRKLLQTPFLHAVDRVARPVEQNEPSRSTQPTNPTESTDKLYETNPIRLRHLLPRSLDPCHDIDDKRCQKEGIAFAFSGRRYLARCQRI